jgi:hypothetical protein
MRLLMEGDPEPHQLRRGEYRREGGYISICCPDCERTSQIHHKGFEGRFACHRCGLREEVKLTGERA